MAQASGPTKNLLLTLWLGLPFAVLAAIIAIIFVSYGKQKMDARPIGAGAADTGGANALGQLLAGRDPDEIERIARDLREGRLIDPLDWPHGIRFTLEPDKSASDTRVLILWSGEGQPTNKLSCGPMGSCTISIPQSVLAVTFAAGRPGAGLYLARSDTITFLDNGVSDSQGRLTKIPIEPVPTESTTPGEPIEIIVRQPD